MKKIEDALVEIKECMMAIADMLPVLPVGMVTAHADHVPPSHKGKQEEIDNPIEKD